MISKRKLNLQFGAEIKDLVAEPHSQHFKSTDGNTYSFEQFKKNPKLAKLLTQGFQYVQSNNSSNKAKLKTNSGLRYGIRQFLIWIEGTNYDGEFNSELLLKYKNYLSNRKSWTAYSCYTVVARIVQELMLKGAIDKFIIPKNIPLQQAKNSSNAGSTIATTITNKTIEFNTDDINEKILSTIIDATWEEVFKMFSYLNKGKELSLNLEKENYIFYKKGMNRQEALEAMIKNFFIEFGGMPSEYPMADKFIGYKNKFFVQMFRSYIYASRHYGWGITAYEINKFFNPTKELVGLILILLCSSHINPESAANLDINCLTPDLNTDIIRVSWIKHRAGGLQTSMPFPKGKYENLKTIPNVLRFYLNSTEHIRKSAPNDAKNLLSKAVKIMDII